MADLKLLVNAGAKVNGTREKDGVTPVWLAAQVTVLGLLVFSR